MALDQELLNELCRIFRLPERLEKREWIKREPDLRSVAINLMSRPQQGRQRG
jgi:hypothetical protein